MPAEEKHGPIVIIEGAGPIDSAYFTAQMIRWKWASGMTPSVLSVSFPADRADDIIASNDGRDLVNVQIQHETLGFTEPQEIDLTIHDLLLLEADPSQSPYEDFLQFADARILLQGLRVWGSYNVRRETGETLGIQEDANGTRTNDDGGGIDVAGESVAAPPGGGVGDKLASPGVMQRLRERSGEDYLPWTIREDGRPYTALEICKHVTAAQYYQAIEAGNKLVLNALRYILEALNSHTPDNWYVRSDLLFRGDLYAEVMDDYLQKAEVGLACKINDPGYYTWWTGDDRGIDQVFDPRMPTMPGGGFLQRKDRKRIRAARVLCRFPRQNEVFLTMKANDRVPGEPGAADDGTTPMRRCYPVIKLPDSVDYLDKHYHKGTWVSIPFALEMWVATSIDDFNPIRDSFKEMVRRAGTRGGDWSKFIRENWFGGRLQWLASTLGDDNAMRPDATWGPRFAALQKYYLQAWMVDPCLYEHVMEIRPERARTVSAVMHVPAEPYVSVDHAEIYEYNTPELITQNPDAKGAVNVTGTANPANAMGAPVTLMFEGTPGNVFTLNFDAKYSGRHLKDVVPSNLVDATIPPKSNFAAMYNTNVNPIITLFWWACQLKAPSDYSGYIILSMVFGTTPRSIDKRNGQQQRRALSYGVVIDAKTAGFAGETNPEMVVEMDITEDTARFGLNDELNVASTPVNQVALDALAAAHARQYYHQTDDRMTGVFKFPGWSDAYRLFGSLRAMQLDISKNSVLTTTFDASAVPKPPDLRNMLPASVRQRVFRELPRAREARKAGKF